MQIYNDVKKRIGTLEGFLNRSITKTLSTGDKELSFDYPANGDKVDLLKEEYYIRTKTDEYVIKQIEKSEKFNRYTATLNVEELEGEGFAYGFASKEQTIRACLEFAFEGTGWKIGKCNITKRRTIDIEDRTTAWGVLQQALKTYRCECLINSLEKTIDIYEQIGQDRGCYFVEGLNLRKLTVKSDTYDFYTRIYPIGKDGIEITWLNGKPYLENYQFSRKIKTYVWKDERYTNTTSLIEDAAAKLEEMSRPYQAYTADVVDLAKASEEFKDILDYSIGDTVTLVSKRTGVKEKQRIVKIVEYDDTEKNTAELSNARKTFAQIQQEETDAAKQEAINIAKKTTKKTLENYSTTEEIETKITASQEKVELGVMHTLESYYDKTETDAQIGIAKGEINLEVSQTYQTKAAMSNYYTQTETRSMIDLAINQIELEVKRVEESSMHNYIANGDFSNAMTDWYVSNASDIYATNVSGLGRVARILKTSSSTAYIRQTLTDVPAGTYRLRYKAATAAGYEATARVQCTALGSTETTAAGILKSTGFISIEREINVTSAGTKYVYFYASVQGAPVYIKDVEILGQYSAYADARLQITADEITTEVDKKVNDTELGTKISQNAYYVRVAWNGNSKYIQFEDGGITVYDGEVQTDKRRAVFDYTGSHFYRDGFYVGKIGTNQWSGNESHKGLVFDLDYQGKYMAFAQKSSASESAYTTMLCFSRANSIYDEYGIHLGCDLYGEWFTLNEMKIGEISAGGYSGYTGAIDIIKTMEPKENGGVSWTYSKLQVRNGIIVGSWM